MKTRKRVLSLILALLLAAALTVPVSAEGTKEANIHWLDVEVPEGCVLGDASYVEELGILSCLLYDEDYNYSYVNIDLATGKQTDRYGDSFIHPFSCGRALIMVDGGPDSEPKYGYLDTAGNIVIAPQYFYAEPFCEDYAVVKKDYNSSWFAYIDVNGTEVFTMDDAVEYEACFRDGVAVVDDSGIIDNHFQYIVEPGVYEDVEEFYDGMAVVTDHNFKQGLINKNGEIVIPCAYDWVYYDGAAELIPVAIYGENDVKFGYVDLTGKVVIPFQYDTAGTFSNGVAYVATYIDGDWDDEFIDVTGKTVLSMTDKGYDSWSSTFMNGALAVAKYDENDAPWFTLIDTSGKELIPWVKGDSGHLNDNGTIEAWDRYDSWWKALYDADGNKVISTDDFDYVVAMNEENLEDDRTPEIIVIADGRFGWFKYSEDYAGTKVTVSDLTDVHPGDWYYDIVKWAVENEITDPLTDTSFGVEVPASREEIVMDLWRACKCPEPLGTVSPFIDVTPANEGYKAILWAYENNIVNGVGDDRFDPSGTLTRADAATILWRAASNPEPASATYPFQDIPAGVYYEKPVVWAYENGIANGTSANSATFSPDDNVLREQMVAFLYRWLVQPAK